MNGFTHYSITRKKLIDLYKSITYDGYEVITQRAAFLTTEQLERIAMNPPPGGLDRFTNNVQISITIAQLINAFEINGADLDIGFVNPARDIPLIYETVQEYIRLWVDIRINSLSYGVATLEELSALEFVSRSLFEIYRYYYDREREKEANVGMDGTEFEMANLALGGLVYGGYDNNLSFVSYLDQYRDRMNQNTETFTTYISKSDYIEPVKQPALNEQFQTPKLNHDLRNWI